MMDQKKIIAMADNYEDSYAPMRRDFHKYAELGWTEFRTTSKIITFLRERNIPVFFGRDVVNPNYVWSYPSPEELEFHKKRAIGQGADPELVEQMENYTGCMAVIDSGKPGPTIAIRVDIDCNDIDEAEDKNHRPYREGFASVNPGFMHACGHDGHAVMGMITAAILNEAKDELCGKVKVIFQLGEEGDKGGQAMAESGILDDVDTALSIHIHGEIGKSPALSCMKEGLLATSKFDVKIHGQAAHAGQAPEEGHNAIMAACMAINGMNGFLQDGRGMTRINVGVIQGGTGRNVIAEECTFKAETRASTDEMEKRLYGRVMACVKAACEAYECTFEVDQKGHTTAAPEDEDLAEFLHRASKQVPELQTVQLIQHCTGATDDFNYMIQKVQEHGGKACYMGLHTKTPSGAHTNWFDFDESCMKVGVKMFLAAVLGLMEESKL